ncbi:MAG: DoxX family protein [Candidatus Nanopelagicus sp.]
MTITLIIFAGLLSFAAIGSAISKLLKVPDVMALMSAVGVKPNQVRTLALLEIAGGLGVILGIWNKELALLSTICLSLYFIGAISAHLKSKSRIADAGAAIGIFVISVITIFLQLQR